MALFKKKINKGDKVEVIKDSTICQIYLGKTGTVLNLCPNPYLPGWLSPSNYNVKIDTPDKSWDNSVFSRKQLKLL